MRQRRSVAAERLGMATAGALAGAAGWILGDVLADVLTGERVFLGLVTGATAFFAVLLLTLGPLRPGRAALGGAAVAIPAAVLMATASLRFDAVGPFLETVHPIAALLLMIALPIPFLIAALGGSTRWSDYPALFDGAWQVLVRASAAVVFTGLVWALIWLSDVLLGLVGIGVIGDLIALAPVPWLVTGVAFGLALAVAHELAAFMSPHLPLRLLRLMTPAVFVVTVIFLAALPFRGLSGLFGDLSAGAIMMAMAFAATTLISSTLDRDDDAAAEGILRQSAAALALLLPVMAGLAVIAVTERVGQYGWTPDRLAAMTGAVVLSGYGVFYALAVVRGRAWMSRIRRVNTGMAVVVTAAAALWLTPLLNPQRISAANQIARFESGRVGAAALDLWSIGNEWGRAGSTALDRLAALDHPEADEMQARIAALRAAGSRFDFETAAPPATVAERLDELRRAISVLPTGRALPEGILELREPGELGLWISACRRRTPGGRPGCAAVVADFVPDSPGEEVILFTLLSDSYMSVTPIFEADRSGSAETRAAHPISGDLTTFAQADTLDRILSGEARIVPKQMNVLSVGGSELVVLP